jgi:hypothetical protein
MKRADPGSLATIVVVPLSAPSSIICSTNNLEIKILLFALATYNQKSLSFD